MEQQYSNRFKDATWFSQQNKETVIVGGAGGIGSWLTFLLVRAGFSAVVFDFDEIKEHNLGGQLFRIKDIGRKKVEALSDISYVFSRDMPNIYVEKFTEDSMNHCFMFSAFDNMEARKAMFNNWKKHMYDYPVTPIFIDGRLTMESFQILCVTPETADRYESEYLFDDSEVEDEPCTLKQTSHSAAMIASHMVAFFTNHLTNIYEKEILRTVPFYYEYYIPMNLTEVK